MNNFNLHTPTRILFGKGAIAGLREQIPHDARVLITYGDAPRDKCTLSCAINGIHAAFHYLKKNYISGCVMTVPTGW